MEKNSNLKAIENEVVVIGAGGHAKVVIEILRASGYIVNYCVGGADAADHCIGVPVLKGDSWLNDLYSKGCSHAFVGIGSNQVRLKLANLVRNIGYELVNAVSPFAVVSPSAKIGVGVAVMAGAVINAEAEIGDLTIINTGATIDHDCRIGQAVHIAPQSALAGTVLVGEGAFLGIGCRILPDISIGKWSVIGAGAVVIKNIPKNVTAVGIPAKALN